MDTTAALKKRTRTENDINTRLVKSWTTFDRLLLLWNTDLSDKIKKVKHIIRPNYLHQYIDCNTFLLVIYILEEIFSFCFITLVIKHLSDSTIYNSDLNKQPEAPPIACDQLQNYWPITLSKLWLVCHPINEPLRWISQQGNLLNQQCLHALVSFNSLSTRQADNSLDGIVFCSCSCSTSVIFSC